MTTKTRQVLREALALSPVDRVSIVQSLLSSLDKPDPGIEVLWAKEAASRLKAYRNGRIKAIPFETAIAKYRRVA